MLLICTALGEVAVSFRITSVEVAGIWRGSHVMPHAQPIGYCHVIT